MCTSGVGTIASMAAVTMMPLGDLAVIRFSAPIFSIFIAKVILKESTSVFKYIFAVGIVIGVTLVVRPPFIFSPETEGDGYHGKCIITYKAQIHVVWNCLQINLFIGLEFLLAFVLPSIQQCTMQ